MARNLKALECRVRRIRRYVQAPNSREGSSFPEKKMGHNHTVMSAMRMELGSLYTNSTYCHFMFLRSSQLNKSYEQVTSVWKKMLDLCDGDWSNGRCAELLPTVYLASSKHVCSYWVLFLCFVWLDYQCLMIDIPFPLMILMLTMCWDLILCQVLGWVFYMQDSTILWVGLSSDERTGTQVK